VKLMFIKSAWSWQIVMVVIGNHLIIVPFVQIQIVYVSSALSSESTRSYV